MANKISSVPFSGTPEQEAKLQELIERLKEQKGALMPILQGAQEIYGYLPIEVQKMIADGLNIPLEEVYGVSTPRASTRFPYVWEPPAMSRAPATYSAACAQRWEFRAANVRRTASSPWRPAAVSAPAGLPRL